MRKDTINQIRSAVGYLENSYLNPVDEDDEAPIKLEVAIRYVYESMMADSGKTAGYSEAVKFDGKNAIIKEIERQIKANEYIKLA